MVLFFIAEACLVESSGSFLRKNQQNIYIQSNLHNCLILLVDNRHIRS